MSSLEIFMWGCFGGLGAEAAAIFAIMHNKSKVFPYWLKSVLYYVILLVMICCGGVVTLAYARSGTDVTPLLAIQIGASTPLILRRLRDTAPETRPTVNPSKID